MYEYISARGIFLILSTILLDDISFFPNSKQLSQSDARLWYGVYVLILSWLICLIEFQMSRQKGEKRKNKEEEEDDDDQSV